MHVTAGHAAQHERPTLPAKYLHVLCPACCHSLLCNSTLSKEAGLGARLIHIECQSTEKLKSWKGTTFQSGSQVGWQQCWPQRSESTPSLSQDPAQCHQHLMQQAPPPHYSQHSNVLRKLSPGTSCRAFGLTLTTCLVWGGFFVFAGYAASCLEQDFRYLGIIQDWTEGGRKPLSAQKHKPG